MSEKDWKKEAQELLNSIDDSRAGRIAGVPSRYAVQALSRAYREGMKAGEKGGIAWSVDWLSDNGWADLGKNLDVKARALDAEGRKD